MEMQKTGPRLEQNQERVRIGQNTSMVTNLLLKTFADQKIIEVTIEVVSGGTQVLLQNRPCMDYT